jgi:hypothetical protein
VLAEAAAAIESSSGGGSGGDGCGGDSTGDRSDTSPRPNVETGNLVVDGTMATGFSGESSSCGSLKGNVPAAVMDNRPPNVFGTSYTPPMALDELLRSGVATLAYLPVIAARIPKQEGLDATCHGELIPPFAPPPESAANLSIGDLEQRSSYIDMSASTIPTSSAAGRQRPTPRFRFAELFAGIGGFGVGLEALGGQCVFASELEPACAKLYQQHFGETASLPAGGVAGDIWDVSIDDIPEHDLLVGGFPCQPFSGLGLQPGLADDKGAGVSQRCLPNPFCQRFCWW